MKETILIRADAGEQIGVGHVIRSVALGQHWQDTGGRAVLAVGWLPSQVESRLRGQGMQIRRVSAAPGGKQDANATTRLAEKLHARWIAVDGYQFGADYQKTLKNSGRKVLWIDDYGHAAPYCADLVLNQNLDADKRLYENREAASRLLLGTRYAMLRREFEPWRDRRRQFPDRAEKLLVTLGGGNQHNLAIKIVEALRGLDAHRLHVRLLAVADRPGIGTLRAASKSSGKHIEIITNVADVPAQMAWADVAISGAGTTCWELAFMGLPAAVVVLADNQRPVAESLARRGAVVNLGRHENLSQREIRHALEGLLREPARRRQMGRTLRRLVDGEGAARVCMTLRGQHLRLRPARNQDCRRLWQWANDRQVRAVSYSTEPISWENHQRWFKAKQADPDCRILIALDENDAAVGQIRFDACGRRGAQIAVSVDRNRRGTGLGNRIIDLAVGAVFARDNVQTLHAHVLPGNQASLRAFQKAGFTHCGMKVISGVNSHHFVRRKVPD